MRGALLSLLVLAACGGRREATVGPERAAIAVPPLTTASSAGSLGGGLAGREEPPRSSEARAAMFPTVARDTLPSGLSLAVVPAHALPLVHLRVSIRAGSGYGAPGVAELTAMALHDGGTRAMSFADLEDRLELLGSELSVEVGLDGTRIGMSVARERLDDAMELLAEVVQRPRFDEKQLRKLRARLAEDASEKARVDGTWIATRALCHELFPAGHPYASFEPAARDLTRVGSPAIRDFHRRFYVPKNVEILAVGDVSDDVAKAAVAKSFGAWRGADPPAVELPPPAPIARRRVVVAHRPKSAGSDVYVASLVPTRAAAEWPLVRTLQQILGGGAASRLHHGLRDPRALATTTRATVLELSHGEQPLIAYAHVDASRTAGAVETMLESVAKMASDPPGAGEVASAARFLRDAFSVRMETPAAIADLLVLQRELGLGDGTWDTYRASLRAATPEEVASCGRRVLRDDRVLVIVAGDADVVAAGLRRFGDVTVVDPEDDFHVVRTVAPPGTAPGTAPDAGP